MVPHTSKAFWCEHRKDFENRFSHPAPKSFAKVDLLPIHNDSEKKKVSKKYK